MNETITANIALVKLNMQAVGLIQDIVIEANIEQQRIMGIGDTVAQEIVSGDVEYRITGKKMVIARNSLLAVGLPGDDEGWITAAPITLELIDKMRGNNIQMLGCKFIYWKLELAAHKIASEHFGLVAQRMDHGRFGENNPPFDPERQHRMIMSEVGAVLKRGFK